MTKNPGLLFVFVLAYFAGITQPREAIDNLRHQIETAKDDTTRIQLQVNMCGLYRLGHTDSSIIYGQQALKEAKEINYIPGEISALSFMSVAMQNMGNLPQALEMAFRAIQLAKLNNQENIAAPALNAIGETYVTLKDYPKATSYLLKQKSICETDNNIEGLAYAWKDLGEVFEQLGQLDSAVYCEQQAIKNFRKTNREEPQVYEVLGNIKLKSRNYAEALAFYQKGLEIAIHQSEHRSSGSAYNKIALVYKFLNQADSGIYYAKKGLEESEIIAQKKTILEATTLLSEFYEKTDSKEALRYLKIAGAYKDSLFGAGNIQAIQTLVAQEEAHQKEIEAGRIIYQTRLKQYVLIAGLGILLLVAFILFRNNRQKQKANKVLQVTLIDLKSTQSQLIQSEKMASLGELTAGIAHEIQNPLNFVNNFSEVNQELIDELAQEARKGNMDEVKEIAKDIKENSEKINHHGKRADAIVKGMMQHSQSSNGMKEPTDINALADEYLRLSWHGMRAKDSSFNTTLKTDFDETIGKINIIPQDIGRVLLNLYNNAFYAVNEKKKEQKDSYEPTVMISTKKNGDKSDSYRVLISVNDNGNGIPQNIVNKVFQPFFTTKPTGQGTGLGLSLAYDIVKAHGGEIKVNTKEGEGSEFIIVIPLKSN